MACGYDRQCRCKFCRVAAAQGKHIKDELSRVRFPHAHLKRTRSLEQWRHASRRNKFAPIAPCQAATKASVWAVGPSVKYCMRDDFSLDFFRALAAPGSQSHHARPRALRCRHQHAEGFLKWCGWPSISKGKARERGRAPGRSYSNLRGPEGVKRYGQHRSLGWSTRYHHDPTKATNKMASYHGRTGCTT